VSPTPDPELHAENLQPSVLKRHVNCGPTLAYLQHSPNILEPIPDLFADPVVFRRGKSHWGYGNRFLGTPPPLPGTGPDLTPTGLSIAQEPIRIDLVSFCSVWPTRTDSDTSKLAK